MWSVKLRSEQLRSGAASQVAGHFYKIRKIQFANPAKKGNGLVSVHEERL
jgi:translation elongation factor P/translation initiation factor 5A